MDVFKIMKEPNSLISKGMPNVYLNSFYWEKLAFSKLRLFKFKKIVSRSVLGELQLNANLIEF